MTPGHVESRHRLHSGSRLQPLARHLALLIFLQMLPHPGWAQLSYRARFTLEKDKFLLGEPIFCTYTIQNTGSQPFAFSYRTPSRALNQELEQEPRFVVTDEKGRRLADPAARPCGGAKGSVVYGSVTLPPGSAHTERWLLNQWARFSSPGRYRVRALRRLPLLAWDAAKLSFSERPVAYALAIDELRFVVEPASEAQLESALKPYAEALEHPSAPNFAEAVLAVTTLPRPFLLGELKALAGAPGAKHAAERQQALEGLARLGTRAAWEAILSVAEGRPRAGSAAPETSEPSREDSLRAYAILLLAEKGDAVFLPPLLEMVSNAPEGLRGDLLRALGYFRHPRANQVLFERLRSPSPADRVNAVLGLKNLETKDAVPALMAMLNDPDSRVRQVAHFALRTLTGQQFQLAPNASLRESARVAEHWRAWWREKGATFNPVRQRPCRDW